MFFVLKQRWRCWAKRLHQCWISSVGFPASTLDEEERDRLQEPQIESWCAMINKPWMWFPVLSSGYSAALAMERAECARTCAMTTAASTANWGPVNSPQGRQLIPKRHYLPTPQKPETYPQLMEDSSSSGCLLPRDVACSMRQQTTNLRQRVGEPLGRSDGRGSFGQQREWPLWVGQQDWWSPVP